MIANSGQISPDDDECRYGEPGSNGDSPVSPHVSGEGEVIDEYPVIGGKRASARLAGRAIRRRWKVKRAYREECVEEAMSLVRDSDPRVKSEGLGHIIRMEGQNQKDDLPAATTINGPVQINVVKREDWYGNRAHDLAAQRASTPKASAVIPGEIQAGSERPAVGKNGNGTAHHN